MAFRLKTLILSHILNDNGSWGYSYRQLEPAPELVSFQDYERGAPDPPLRVGVICGGPGAERGISLNSARALLDHLHTTGEIRRGGGRGIGWGVALWMSGSLRPPAHHG